MEMGWTERLVGIVIIVLAFICIAFYHVIFDRIRRRKRATASKQALPTDEEATPGPSGPRGDSR